VFGKDGSGSNLNVQNSWANEALAVVVQFEVLRLDTRNRKTGIYLQSTAIRSRFPLRLDRGEGQGEVSNSIHLQSTAIRSRGIATYIMEIAADIQEMAANIGENRSYTRRTTAR